MVAHAISVFVLVAVALMPSLCLPVSAYAKGDVVNTILTQVECVAGASSSATDETDVTETVSDPETDVTETLSDAETDVIETLSDAETDAEADVTETGDQRRNLGVICNSNYTAVENTATTFYPKLDEYAVLRVSQESFSAMDEFEFHIQIGDAVSPVRTFKSLEGGTVTAFWAIVAIVEGEAVVISWENTKEQSACEIANSVAYEGSDCMSSEQFLDTCHQTDCTGDTGTEYDLTIYLTWAGTDSTGEALTSKGLSLESFRQYSTAGIYGVAVDKAEEAAAKGKDTIDNLGG